MSDAQLAELIDAIRWSVHTGVFQIILVQLIIFWWGRRKRS